MLDHIGTELRQRRRALGLSQDEVARRAGLAQSYYSRVELNKIEPRVGTLAEIARALDLEFALVPRELVPAIAAIASPGMPAEKQRLFAAIGD